MENGAGVNRPSGRAPDALEATVRRLRASAARPPPPLRCALARTPTTPAIVRLVGIAVSVFPVPADFEGGLDAMIQPVAEALYVNQAMGEPEWRLDSGSIFAIFAAVEHFLHQVARAI